MITVDEYLAYCDEALDGYAAIVRQLGDDLVNARLDGIPGANTASGLVAHVAGDDGSLGEHGQPRRRRAARPRRRVHRHRHGRRRPADCWPPRAPVLHEDARAAVPREHPANPPPPRGRLGLDATQGEVLLHVYEELAQHLGQLEVTRDVLLAPRRPRGNA